MNDALQDFPEVTIDWPLPEVLYRIRLNTGELFILGSTILTSSFNKEDKIVLVMDYLPNIFTTLNLPFTSDGYSLLVKGKLKPVPGWVKNISDIPTTMLHVTQKDLVKLLLDEKK